MGPVYSSTAAFADTSTDLSAKDVASLEQYSVVITLGSTDEDGRVEAKFRFLALDLIGSHLKAGAKFFIMEGSHPVAEASISALL
jgi:hypothetical protein